MLDHPLRLTKGSHEAGSGKGCAMNVVSWENGDLIITDYPRCSAPELARMVQEINDSICYHTQKEDFLCSECSQIVLDLGHATIGTSSATKQQKDMWFAELLTSSWGFYGLTQSSSIGNAIGGVAFLCRQRASTNFIDGAKVRDVVSALTSLYNTYYMVGRIHSMLRTLSELCQEFSLFSDTGTAPVGFNVSAVTYAMEAFDYANRPSFVKSAIEAWHRICETTPNTPETETVELAVKNMLKV